MFYRNASPTSKVAEMVALQALRARSEGNVDEALAEPRHKEFPHQRQRHGETQRQGRGTT